MERKFELRIFDSDGNIRYSAVYSSFDSALKMLENISKKIAEIEEMAQVMGLNYPIITDYRISEIEE